VNSSNLSPALSARFFPIFFIFLKAPSALSSALSASDSIFPFRPLFSKPSILSSTKSSALLKSVFALLKKPFCDFLATFFLMA
jgi:hypothetical protein